MNDLYNGIIIHPGSKNHEVRNWSLTFSSYRPRKKNKNRKIFMFGWYMPIINRAWVHHIAQLMNKLKPTLHFPIKDARSVG